MVRDGLERGQKKPTGRGTVHSLVPEHNTLNAGAKENHAAEVWAVLRKLGVYQIVAPIHSPHSALETFPVIACRHQKVPWCTHAVPVVCKDVKYHACVSVVCPHTLPGNLRTKKSLLTPALPCHVRIQTSEVVTMARMVPTGIDFWASRRSPERFEPAMMPQKTDKIPSGSL